MMGDEACMFGMAGMGLISVLLIIGLVLGVAALVKYLFFNKKAEVEGTHIHKGKDFSATR